MMKRLAIAAVILWASIASCFAAGTIPLSMTQQLDKFGVPLSGCQLFTIQAGTTSTPQNAYKDTALSLVQPNPMVCDASGRLPQFFLADGQIKIRLLDKLGNTQVVLDNILVIGPSSGGGSGATIDPTTIASTGDLKQVYGTQVITGWVRFNGRTIGNATSGATERANADTQALFLYLWAADPNLTVSGGRTTAAADYAANKTITLPDARGRALSGLDDMGNAAAGRLTATYFGATGGCSGVLGTTLGAACGGESQLLTVAQIPAHAHANTLNDPGHVHGFGGTGVSSVRLVGTGGLGGSSNTIQFNNGTDGTVAIVNATTGITLNNVAQGGGLAHPTIDPRILVTIYAKL